MKASTSINRVFALIRGIKTFLGGCLGPGRKGASSPVEFLFRKLASSFKTMLRFFVSGLKRHLAHGQFFLVPELSERPPETFPSTVFWPLQDPFRVKIKVMANSGVQVKGKTRQDPNLGSK